MIPKKPKLPKFWPRSGKIKNFLINIGNYQLISYEIDHSTVTAIIVNNYKIVKLTVPGKTIRGKTWQKKWGLSIVIKKLN